MRPITFVNGQIIFDGIVSSTTLSKSVISTSNDFFDITREIAKEILDALHLEFDLTENEKVYVTKELLRYLGC